MPYTKLDHNILDSSVWQETKETRLLWITLLAMKDQHGNVFAAIPGLAKRAGLTLPETVASLALLLGPDPYSRTPTQEGRRIETIQGGWYVINHAIYSVKYNQEERREYLRLAKQKERANLPKNAPVDPPPSGDVNTCQQMSTLSTHVDVDVDVEEGTPLPPVSNSKTLEADDYDLARGRVALLNILTGSQFQPPLHDLDQIISRLLEVNRDVDGVDAMLRRQVALWKNDPRARHWLKPGTLFGANFHDYYGQRNQPVNSPEIKNAPAAKTELLETEFA